MVYALFLLLTLLLYALLWFNTYKRRETLFGGLFTLPIVGLSRLLAYGGQAAAFSWQDWLQATALTFLFGSIVFGIYFAVVHPLVTPARHPDRHWLALFLLGPLLGGLSLVLGVPILIGLACGLVLDILVIFFFRSILLWDALFSGFLLGSLYVITRCLFNLPLQRSYPHLWITPNLTGLTLFSFPIEELAATFLLGFLLGPVYSGFIHWIAAVPAPREFLPHHLRWKQIFGITALSLSTLSGGLFVFYFVAFPRVVYASPTETRTLGLTDSVTIRFDRPIDNRRAQVTVSPPIAGGWHFDDSLLGNRLFRTIIFTPDTHWAPGTSYTLTLSQIGTLAGSAHQSQTYHFTTEALPTITKASLAEGAQDVAACTDIRFPLSSTTPRLAKFDAEIDPPLAFTFTEAADHTSYLLQVPGCLNQGTAYTVHIRRSLTVYNNDVLTLQEAPVDHFSFTFHTKAAPTVSAFSPQGSALLPKNIQTVTLAFDQDMTNQDPSQFLTFSPALSGQWQWQTSKTLALTLAKAPEFATTYTLAVAAGIPTTGGGHTTTATSYSFQTIGAVQVTKISPRHQSTGVAVNTPVRISFDQPVDHASAEQALSIDPAVTGQVSWDGATLVYQANFAKDTSYTIRVANNVVSLDGLPSTKTYISQFQTEESTHILGVALDFQDSPLSCEVASLKMALAYRGISVSESTLLDQVGYDPTPHVGSVWGDPDSGFVGSVTGHQDTTGYGVHWGPIARVAASYRSAQAFTGWSIQDLTTALSAGDPVVVWGIYSGSATRDSWTTPSGKTVSVWKGEHVRTAIGFTGSADHPNKIILNDPVSGRLTWTTSQFLANWGTFGNSGVVVQ